jgi:hypothetical protein
MKASDSNLDFDGMAGNGVNRGKDRFAGNQYSGVQNPNALVNKGRGPTKGNQDYNAGQGAHREPPTAGVPAFKTGKDMFTGTAQVRNPGGTRAWDPKREQNYKGNADKMNVGRGPTKGNQQ